MVFEAILHGHVAFFVGTPLVFGARLVPIVHDVQAHRLLYFIQNVGGGAGELIEIGEPADGFYNSMGFCSKDMRLYAIRSDSNELLQIGRGGAVTDLGPVSGLPVKQYNSADFGDGAYAATLFVRVGTNDPPDTDYMWLVDVETRSATRMTLSAAVPNTADLVYMQDYLWALDGTFGATPRIFRIHPVNGQVDEYSLAGLGLTMQIYGAQWRYSVSDIGISGNDTGEIYRIHIDNATSASPDFSVVTKIIGPATKQNDGASYIGIVTDSIYT